MKTGLLRETRRIWLHAILFISVTLSPTVTAADTPLLERKGCLACHSTDGSRGPAPTFSGLFGRTTQVTTAGEARSFTVDEAYVIRSIEEPSHDIVVGYAAMPQLPVSNDEVSGLVLELQNLPARRPPQRSLIPLALSTLGFLFLHLFLSFHPVRRRLQSRLGRKGFEGLYSLAVLVPFIAIFYAWPLRSYVPLWELGEWARWVPLIIMPFSVFFILSGYTTKSPFEEPPKGAVSITRHPTLLGYALWACAHLFPNGDLASLLLFGSIAALSILGMVHIDVRKERELGETYRNFSAQTSVIPMLAIWQGRCHLDATGLWWRALLALLGYGATLLLHEAEVGVSPLPYF